MSIVLDKSWIKFHSCCVNPFVILQSWLLNRKDFICLYIIAFNYTQLRRNVLLKMHLIGTNRSSFGRHEVFEFYLKKMPQAEKTFNSCSEIWVGLIQFSTERNYHQTRCLSEFIR